MLNYANENIEFEGCPGCAYARHEFSLPCGIAYENEKFNMSQDWELPIPAFFVVSPNRCVDNFGDLTFEEQIEIYDIVNKTIKILRENNVCDRFNVIFEEKENRHFHIWIMPRYKWMEDKFGNITQNIGNIFKYAKSDMRTEEVFNQINNITNLVKMKFQEKEKRNN